MARLFPLLWALLALNALAAWVHPIAGVHPPSPLGFLSLIGYVGNWLPALGHNGLFGLEYVWSLSVEEQFYVVWPLVVAGLLAFAAHHRGRGRDGSTGDSTPWIVGGVALAAAVTIMVLRVTVFADTYFFFNTALRADGLLLGAALAATRRSWQHRISPAASSVAIVASVIVIGAVVAVSSVLDPQLGTWKLPLLEVAVVVLAGALVAVPTTFLAGYAGRDALVWLGRRSYALYLVHLPVFDIVEAHLGAGRPRLRAVVELPLALLVAHLAHVLLELPAQRRLRRVLRADHRPAEHAPADPERVLVR